MSTTANTVIEGLPMKQYLEMSVNSDEDFYTGRRSSTHRDPTQFYKTKPPILNIYLKNITLNSGDMALIKCPTFLTDIGSFEVNNLKESNKLIEKISFKNQNIKLNEFLTIKTVSYLI